MSPSTFDARKEEFEDITEWGYNNTIAYKDKLLLHPSTAAMWSIC